MASERTPAASPDASVAAALAAITGRRIVVVGDSVLDTYIYGRTLRVSREAPVIVVRKEAVEHRLGGAANVATNLAALGLDVELLGCVGEDVAGARLRRLLVAGGVDVTGVRRCAMATPEKTRVLAGARGTSRQQVLRIDEEPGTMPSAIVAEVSVALTDRGAHCDGVVVSDYGIGSVGPDTITAARELAGGGQLVCVDSRHRLGDFVGVSAVTPNLSEAEGYLGYELADEGALARAGGDLLERLQCRYCLLTRGRAGMSLFGREGERAAVPIVGVDEVTDVTGAGDTVIATVAAGLAAGLGGMNSMLLANCAAGIVVAKVGTAVAAPAELVAASVAAGIELAPWGE